MGAFCIKEPVSHEIPEQWDWNGSLQWVKWSTMMRPRCHLTVHSIALWWHLPDLSKIFLYLFHSSSFALPWPPFLPRSLSLYESQSHTPLFLCILMDCTMICVAFLETNSASLAASNGLRTPRPPICTGSENRFLSVGVTTVLLLLIIIMENLTLQGAATTQGHALDAGKKGSKPPISVSATLLKFPLPLWWWSPLEAGVVKLWRPSKPSVALKANS